MFVKAKVDNGPSFEELYQDTDIDNRKAAIEKRMQEKLKGESYCSEIFQRMMRPSK